MPGSGKTFHGKRLAKALDYDFIDTDVLIFGDINQIINERGERYFRRLEHNVLKSLKPMRSVISTGGGAVLLAENRLILKKLGTVIYLQATAAKLLTNLQTPRPLLKRNINSIRQMLSFRHKLYVACADYVIKT